jgi:hypothetical protein
MHARGYSESWLYGNLIEGLVSITALITTAAIVYAFAIHYLHLTEFSDIVVRIKKRISKKNV